MLSACLSIRNPCTLWGLYLPNEEVPVPYNKSKRGKADRSRVAGNEGYEVNYFANKHGITPR
jgi:hypothetical protein